MTTSAPVSGPAAQTPKPKPVPRAELVARIVQLEESLNEETAEKEHHRKWQRRYLLTAIAAVLLAVVLFFLEFRERADLIEASSQVTKLKTSNEALDGALKVCQKKPKEVIEPPKCEQPTPKATSTPQSAAKKAHKPASPPAVVKSKPPMETTQKAAQVPAPQASVPCATDCVPLRPSTSSTPQVCKIENGKVYCNFQWKVLHTTEEQASCGCKISQARPTGTVVVGFFTAKEGSELCRQQQDAFTFIQGDRVAR